MKWDKSGKVQRLNAKSCTKCLMDAVDIAAE